MIDPSKQRKRKHPGPLIRLVSKKFFAFFNKQNKEHGIQDATHMKMIMRVFHEEMIQMMSTERDGFLIPKFAYMVIRGFTPDEESVLNKTKFVNYHLSNLYKKRIIYSNLETDGKMCKIFFVLRHAKGLFKLKQIWAFRPARPFKKAVSENFKKNYNLFTSFINN